MTFWCIQDNECLACVGGCVGYEWKREAMRERRADFWRRISELEAKETKTMGYSDTQAKQAMNTDKLLHREPCVDAGPAYSLDSGYDYKLSLTRWGGISIDIAGYVITKTLKQWHTLAADDFKRQEEMSAQIQAAKPDWPDKWVAMDFGKIEERVIGSLAPDKPVKAPTFAQKLASLLNEASKERGSNTPDFVLAEYLTNCLGNFEAATKARETWYGVKVRPGDPLFENCETMVEPSEKRSVGINLSAGQLQRATVGLAPR